MIYRLLLFAFLMAAAAFRSGAAQQQQCNQLQNCMDISLKLSGELQQYSGSSGSYSALSVHTGSVQCRSLRTNFECMLNQSPYCLRSDLTRNVPQYIGQAKQLLDSHCDQGTSWSNTQCYRKPEITGNCETMLPELNIGNYNYYAASVPRPICEKYQRFRQCVYNVLLTQCTPIERETFFSYLYDKVQEVSWKCANDTMFFENYERYHPLTSALYSNGGSVYTGGLSAQPPYTYNGMVNNYAGAYPPPAYGRFNVYDRNRAYYDGYGGTRYGSPTGYGDQGYGSGLMGAIDGYAAYDETTCIQRTAGAAKVCEDAFLQSQRDARNQRTAIDLQRRLCCSMYNYRNCLAATVMKYCRGNFQSVVDTLMGEGRRRELIIGCRENSFTECNSSLSSSLSYLLILLATYLGYLQLAGKSHSL